MMMAGNTGYCYNAPPADIRTQSQSLSRDQELDNLGYFSQERQIEGIRISSKNGVELSRFEINERLMKGKS